MCKCINLSVFSSSQNISFMTLFGRIQIYTMPGKNSLMKLFTQLFILTFFLSVYSEYCTFTYKGPNSINSQSLSIVSFCNLRVYTHVETHTRGGYPFIVRCSFSWNKKQMNIKMKYMLFKMSYQNRAWPLTIYYITILPLLAATSELWILLHLKGDLAGPLGCSVG